LGRMGSSSGFIAGPPGVELWLRALARAHLYTARWLLAGTRRTAGRAESDAGARLSRDIRAGGHRPAHTCHSDPRYAARTAYPGGDRPDPSARVGPHSPPRSLDQLSARICTGALLFPSRGVVDWTLAAAGAGDRLR